jgi:hypothetical protein
MEDGSCLAFFEVPGLPFDFKEQNALDLHIALGVEPETFENMLGKAKAQGREVRGPVDHGFVRSIYFRDPDGYVIELTASTGAHSEMMDPAISKPYEILGALAGCENSVARILFVSDKKRSAPTPATANTCRGRAERRSRAST